MLTDLWSKMEGTARLVARLLTMVLLFPVMTVMTVAPGGGDDAGDQGDPEDDGAGGEGEGEDDPEDDEPEDDDFDRERAMNTIRKQREEAKRLKAQLKEHADAEAARQKEARKGMKESERLQAELDDANTALATAQTEAAEWRSKYESLHGQGELRGAVAKAKLVFAAPSAEATAWAIVEELTEEDDEPDYTAAVKVLKKDHAYLFTTKTVPPDIDGKKKPGDEPEHDEEQLKATYGIS